MSYVLPFKPGAKVLELGGGENPTFRPNLDIRRLPTVDIVCNLEERFPVEDSSYDGVFGKYIIEHISWRRVPFFVKEIFRVLKPGGIAVLIGPNTLEQCRVIAQRGKIGPEESCMLFGGQEEPGWNEHKSAFSPEYIVKLFKDAGFETVIVKPSPGCPTDLIVEAYKSGPTTNITEAGWYKELEATFEPQPLKLNIGSYTVMFKGWLNIDVLDLSSYAKANGYDFRQLDVRYGLPFKDNSVEAIVCSHMLEHLTREEGDKFLRECLRVLKPGAVIRLAVPDAKLIAKAYVDGKIREFVFNEGVKNAKDDAEAFLNLLMSNHRTVYDYEALKQKMEKIGFVNIQRMPPGKSLSQAIETETKDMYPEISLYVEGLKPTCTTEQAVTVSKSTRKAGKKLKVALISTPFFGVPPRGYSGLEMIVWDLACALSKLGHEVTIIAPKGSRAPPRGHVIETNEPLFSTDVNWLQAEQADYRVYEKYLQDFDIIHGHNWFGFEYLAKTKNPDLKVCHTHHGHLNTDWWCLTRPPFKLNFIAISDWMRTVYATYGITAQVVYNGIDLKRYPYKADKGERLLFVGRFDSFKQPHVAIEIAKRLNMGLDLVGGTFVQDKEYLKKIQSLCDGKQIRMFPDAPHDVKVQLMQNAKALLFPSKMGEPFGLVAVEAMACGTPVIALKDGAIPEVVKEGGIVCNTVDEMVEAVKRVDTIKPTMCRKNASRFSRENMALKYERIYFDILEGKEF